MNYHYSMTIQWSDEDNLFLVTLPEFTDVMQPCTHGKTYIEAVNNAQDLIDSLIENLSGRWTANSSTTSSTSSIVMERSYYKDLLKSTIDLYT